MTALARVTAVLPGLLLLWISVLPAQPAASTVPCVTCHEEPASWATRRKVHAPVASGDCLTCHSPHASRHGKLVKKSTARVCLECHEDLTERARGRGAHAAVTAERSCVSCHDPHASDETALLLNAVPGLCAECHQDVPSPRESAHPHAPAAGGACLTCLAPHGSEQGALAVDGQPGLCAGCHDTGSPGIRRAHQAIDIGTSSCISCHAPHGSSLEKLIRLNTHAPFEEGTCEICHRQPGRPPSELRAEAKELCLGCHEPHDAGHPVDVGDACVSCHTPHTSSGVALIAGSEDLVCTACHEDIGVRQAASVATHPTPEEGQHCSVCHALHSGETRSYLKRRDALSVCNECHLQHTQFAHPMGRGVLDRSRKGRTVDCLSCHDPHGTSFPGMLLADPRRDLCIRCHTDSMMGAGQ